MYRHFMIDSDIIIYNQSMVPITVKGSSLSHQGNFENEQTIIDRSCRLRGHLFKVIFTTKDLRNGSKL